MKFVCTRKHRSFICKVCSFHRLDQKWYGVRFFSSYRQQTTMTHFVLVILNVAHFSSWRFKILFMSFSFFAIYFVVVAVVVPFSIHFACSRFRIHLIQSRNDNRSFKLLSTALNALTRNIIRLQINKTTTTVMTAIINMSFFHLFFLFCLSFFFQCIVSFEVWFIHQLGTVRDVYTTESNFGSFTCVIEMNLLRKTLWMEANRPARCCKEYQTSLKYK